MLRGFLLALCALALFAPSALAAEDEIFVDPDSPSGKEYALPIDRARKEAAPATKGARANAATPLFGEGVDSTRSRASAGRRSGATAGGAKTRGSGTRERAETADTAEIVGAAPKTLQAQAASPDGGIGVAAIIGGVGAGVLLLGGAIGMLLRRRASRSG